MYGCKNMDDWSDREETGDLWNMLTQGNFENLIGEYRILKIKTFLI